MIYVYCYNKVKKEDIDVFMTAAKEHAKMSKGIDDGCIAFDVSKYNEETEEVAFFERWENMECLQKHAKRCEGLPLLEILGKSRYEKSLKIYEI